MAKPKSLLDQLKADEAAAGPGPTSWHERFAVADPELKQQMDDLIDAWNAGDVELRAKQPTKNALARWLIAHINGHSKRPETIINYINARAAHNGTQG